MPAASSSTEDAGELVFATSSDQLSQPHRLTWFAEGRWWAVFRKSSGEGSGWRVWRQDTNGTWAFGPEVFSTAGPDRFDAFLNPDDGRVFVHHLNASQSRLLRLEFDAASDMFRLAASAAVPTAYDGKVSTLTVDTAGRVWIATHPDGQFAYTIRDANTLAQIAPLTVLTDRVATRSLVAGRFVDANGPAVGFAYSSDVKPYTGTFRIHRDHDPVHTFTTEVFGDQVDDHATFAAAGSDVVAVWKDKRDIVGEPITLIRRRHPSGGWGPIVSVFDAKSSDSGGNHTRPRVVIDADNRQVHVAAAEITATAQEVHERVAHMDTLAFGPQRVIFRSGSDENGHVFRDVHAGQQPVTAASGLLWLARGRAVTDGVLGSFSLWANRVEVPPVPEDPDPPGDPEPSVEVTSLHPPIDEGSSVTVTASVEAAADTAQVDWGEGTVVSVPLQGGTVSASHAYPDDDEYTITVSTSDGSGGAVTDSVVQRVDNVAPVIVDDSGDVTVQVDDEFTFDVTFSDPGLLDTHRVTVDFGDGVTSVMDLALGARTASATHRYASDGAATIVATVADSDGSSTAVSRQATVTVGPETPGQAPVVYRGGSVASTQSANALSVSRPPESEVGDVLLASVTVSGKPTMSAPAGWDLVRSDRAGKDLTTATFVRVVDAGEPETYQWEFSVQTAAAGQVLAYSGVDPAAPVLASGGQSSGPRSTTVSAPSVTTTVDGAQLVAVFSVATVTALDLLDDLQSRTRVTSSGGLTGAVGDVAQESAGATGSFAAQPADVARGIGQLFALRPAGT